MKRILGAIMLTLGVGAGGLALAPTAAHATEPVNFSETRVCHSVDAAAYGSRVCYDSSAGMFGIYDNAGFVQAFPSNNGYTGGAYLPSQYSTNPNLAGVWVQSGGGTDDAFYDAGCACIKATAFNSGANNKWPFILNQGLYDTTQNIYVYGGNFNILAWYLNTPGYELIIVD